MNHERHFDLTRAATEALLRIIQDTPGKSRRVMGRTRTRVVLVCVWEVGAGMPTAVARPLPPDPPPPGGQRLRAVILGAVAAGPLSRKDVVAAVAAAGHECGRNTVWKCLAFLTEAGELVNPRDNQGYRLPGWRPPPEARPGLFGGPG